MNKNIITLVVLLFVTTFTYGQTFYRTALASGGQNYTEESSGYSISCTMGEPVVGTIGSTEAVGNIIFTQGFQQGTYNGEVSIIPIEYNIDLNIYPNPVAHELHILFEGVEIQRKLHIEILDLNGKTIITKNELQMNEEYIINTSSLVSGMYMLRISSNARILETVRFIKQ